MQIAAVMCKFMQYIKVVMDLILLAVTVRYHKEVPFCARPVLVADTRWMCRRGSTREHPA